MVGGDASCAAVATAGAELRTPGAGAAARLAQQARISNRAADSIVMMCVFPSTSAAEKMAPRKKAGFSTFCADTVGICGQSWATHPVIAVGLKAARMTLAKMATINNSTPTRADVETTALSPLAWLRLHTHLEQQCSLVAHVACRGAAVRT